MVPTSRRAAGLALRPQHAIAQERPDGLLVLVDALLNQYKSQIVDFTIHKQLPAVFPFREFTELGGLMSYGPNLPDMFRIGAGYVDKILKGAKPVDLPIEQPTKSELVINLTTSKALGLEILPQLLARADEVIE